MNILLGIFYTLVAAVAAVAIVSAVALVHDLLLRGGDHD